MNEQVVANLRAIDADVLVLPEAWRFRIPDTTWSQELAAELGYELHQWVSDTPSRAREVVPFHMVVLTRIPAHRLPDIELPNFGPFGKRSIVQVELPESGLVVAGAHMYGIHLLLQRSPRGWWRERTALGEVASTVDVLAGDMNMWGPMMERDAAPLRRAVKGRTFPAKRPHSQIDHILVSDQVRVVSSKVFGDMGSDHRAVKATLQPDALVL